MNLEGWLWFALLLSWALAPALYTIAYWRGYKKALSLFDWMGRWR